MAGYHSQTTVLFGHVCGFYYMAAPHRREYLPQVSLSVDAQLISSTSRTTLTQSFVNPKADPIPELRYSFPLYDGVSVVSFKCTINKDRVITGVVQEKAEARKTYNQAIERGETAALLEQLPEASDVFTTTVGNVPANASLDVEITYLGELKHDAEVDGIRFTIPTTIAPRYGDYPGQLLRSSVVNSGGINITIDAQMADGSNIKTIQSPTHPISVTVGNTSKGSAAGAEMSLQKASATLALGTTELDKDFVLHVVATNISNPVAVLETHPRIQNQRALMATLVPKFNLPSTRPEIVFVADRSGSMGMDNRIPDLKTAMQLFLKSLPVGVKFNICSFGSHHEFLFPDGSQSYDASTLEKATQYVKGFDSNFGGTDIYRPMEDVIEKRFKDMNLEIFLLTDGEIWDQEKLFSMLNEQIPQSDGAIRVFTLGIGRDVSHSLIEGVARAGNGFAQVVGDNEKMNSKVVRMLKASLTPHVSDYTLEVKYGKDADAPPPYNDDDDFEIVEKVMDGLTVDVSEPKQEKVATESSKPISLFDESADPDAEMVDATLDSSAGGKYSHVPPVSEPRILQAPFTIPPLFPFSRTTVYLLLSPDTVQKQPKSVVLRGMSPHGPLELEIPVTVLPEKGETIHQLAARKATRELEDGRGWIYHAKDETGKLLKKKYEGRFSDMVEREAVRLGVTYQIGGKWTSFVAVEANNDKGQSSQHVEPSTEEKFQAMQRGERLDTLTAQGSEPLLLMSTSFRRKVAPMPLFGGARLAPRAAQAVQVAQAAPFRSETLASLQTQPESLSDKSQKSVSKKKGRAFFGGTFASVSNAASGLFGSAPAPTFSSYAAPPPPPSMFMSAGAPAPASSLFGSAPTAVANHAAPAPGSSLFGSVSTAAASYAAPPYPPPMFVPAPVPEGSSPANLIGGPPPRASKKLGFGWMKPASVQSDRREQMDESMPLPDEDEEESQDAFASTGDKLDAIVALQTFEGKWVWSDRLLAILELKKDELKVKQSDEVATAIVLAYLEMKLADRKEEWEMLAEKAQEWLSGQGMNVGEEVAKVKGLF